jgi:hypothetical protein
MSAPAATAPSASALAEGLQAIGLPELVATAALLERLDRKYVVPLELLEPLAPALRRSHRVLAVDGRRVFRYRTLYYDTPELTSFRDHVRGRRRRFKCRVREYVDAREDWLEIKLKGRRGRTDKVRVRCAQRPASAAAGPLLAVLDDALRRAYGRPAPPLLVPVLSME